MGVIGLHLERARAAASDAALAGIVLIIGFFLRVWPVSYPGIWGDEAYSIFVSSKPLEQVVAAGADTHPPLYHVLLHHWMLLFGQSEFALRFLSVAIGLIAVALTFALGRRLLGPRVALVAGLITALSPFQVYYSQEVRMYALAMVLGLASVYFLVRLLDRPSWLRVILYLLASVAAGYSHYYAFFVLAAEVVFVIYWTFWTDAGRQARVKVAAVVAVWVLALLAYVPWIIIQSGFIAGRASARTSEWGLAGARQVFSDSLTSFAVGATWTGCPATVVALVLFVAVLVGLVSLLRERTTRPWGVLLALCSALPLVLAFLVNPFMPFFYPRYVLVATPAYYLALAAAVVFLARRWKAVGGLLLALIVIVSAYSLSQYYTNPQFARSGYGRAMEYVQAHAGPNDVIILGNVLQQPLFDYYRPSAPRDSVYFPTDYLTSDERTGAAIADLMANHERAWLFLYGDPAGYDPNGDLKRWLSASAFLAYSEGFGDGQLLLYAKPTTSANGQAVIHQEIGANFGNLIELTSVDFPAHPTSPGQPVYLTLNWKCLVPTSTRYTVFAHLVDGGGQKLGQMDSEPGGGTHPTSAWQPGETVKDSLALMVSPDAAPGQYSIDVGLYDLATMKRLPVIDSAGQEADQRVVLKPVAVGP